MENRNRNYIHYTVQTNKLMKPREQVLERQQPRNFLNNVFYNMNTREASLEMEFTDEEKIHALETRSVGEERATGRNRISRCALSIIKNSPFISSCCLIQVICFCLENDEIMHKFCYAPDKRDQLWRVVTYAFLHSNLYHLIPNLLLVLITGITLEYDQGTLRTFIVYTSGVISGALGCNLFGERQKVVGASAASYSLLMAHIVHLKFNWKTVRYKDYRIVIVACLLLSDVASYYLSLYLFQNISVSWISHFSASINGLLISAIILDSIKPCHSYRYFSLSVYVALMTFSSIIFIPWLANIAYQYSR